jgi:hypothetical protein
MGKPITAEQVVSMWCSGYGVLVPFEIRGIVPSAHGASIDLGAI